MVDETRSVNSREMRSACHLSDRNVLLRVWFKGRAAEGGGVMADLIETNIFDIEEIHHNCTVQILTNSVTGEVSVGWWPNEPEEGADSNDCS